MKVYEALAQAFVDEGTTDVYGMMGDANMYWMNALDKLGVRMYEVRHEGAGLAMADGWARTTGRPGVCTTTSGPGTAQLATTMLVASRACTPLVAFCGESNLGEPDAAQGLDQARFAAAIECGFVHLPKDDGAYDAVQRAFYLARLESRPIMLSAPMDVQQHVFEPAGDYVTSTALLGNFRLPGAPELISKAADMLEEAEHIVILVGRGARHAEVGDLVTRLQNRTGAIVATTLQAKNWLRDASDFHVGISGLYSTKTAMELFQEADCVLAVGATLNKYTTEHGYLYPEAKYIQIDKKSHVIMGNGAVADCYIQADALPALEALDKELESRSVHHVGYHLPEVKERLLTSFEDNQVFDIEEGVVDPRAAHLALDEEMPTHIPLVMGGGHQMYHGTMLYSRPRDVFANMMFGCIGQGLTTAMGFITATGNKPAFLCEGDASFMMHLGEFETACRYNMPLFVVVFNDECLGSEYQKSISAKLDTELTLVPSPDLGIVGQGLGGHGRLVRTIEDLRSEAREFIANPKTTLIDLRISKNVLAVPYRRLWYGMDI